MTSSIQALVHIPVEWYLLIAVTILWAITCVLFWNNRSKP
jgi:hypothetical protein